jgi:uncharacterized membrane protein
MNFYKINIPKSVVILIAFSVALNILRVIIWGKLSFVYILWNIFLAIIPFVISSLLLSISNKRKINQITFIAIGIIWLLFLPNSPYIITDLIHIGEVRFAPDLFDSFLLFSSAWTGLLLGMHSINHMEQILSTRYSKKITSTIIVITMFFVSFGIYLGRFLRLNSWDVFASPGYFLGAIKEIFTNKNDFQIALSYTVLFFFFILASYYSWKFSQKND